MKKTPNYLNLFKNKENVQMIQNFDPIQAQRLKLKWDPLNVPLHCVSWKYFFSFLEPNGLYRIGVYEVHEMRGPDPDVDR